MVGTQAQAQNLEQKLRFSCPACELKLAVPLDLAGVRAPCPGCGCEITAPTGAKPDPKPIRVLPRPARPRAKSAEQSEAEVPVLKEPVESMPPRRRGQWRFQAGQKIAASEPVPERASPVRLRPRRSGSVYAGTGISERYQERKDMVSLAKISVAIALVVALALAIAFVTKNKVDPGGPAPVPEVPKLDPTRI